VQSRQGRPAELNKALSADLDNLLHQINPGDAERAHPRVDIGVDALGALPPRANSGSARDLRRRQMRDGAEERMPRDAIV
jgi:hypothetical protein